MLAFPLALSLAPAASSLLSSPDLTKSCCPTKGHGCCQRDKAAGDGLHLAAVMKCPRQCGVAASYAFYGCPPLPSARDSCVGAAPESKLPATERVAFSASSYPSFLYQRPPPSV